MLDRVASNAALPEHLPALLRMLRCSCSGPLTPSLALRITAACDHAEVVSGSVCFGSVENRSAGKLRAMTLGCSLRSSATDFWIILGVWVATFLL